MMNPFRQWFRGVEVAEISLSLPFVQISLKPADAASEEIAERASPLPPASSVQPQATVAVQAPAAVAGQPQVVELLVTERGELPAGTAANALLSAYISYRLCYEVRDDGSYRFQNAWRKLQGAIDTVPGDIMWLRLNCYNRAGRLLHHVPLAMRDMPWVERLPGIVTHKLGEDQIEVRRAATGMTIGQFNPTDVYSLHCVGRVPLDLRAGTTLTLEPLKKGDLAAMLKQHGAAE